MEIICFVYIVYIDLFTMDNRVVNMRIIIQNVFPASVPQSNSNNNTGGYGPAWAVVDNTNYSNPIYSDISSPYASEGTVTFGSRSAGNVADKREFIQVFVPSWKR